MLRFQANVANAFQESTLGWVQRRQEAAEDAIETFDRLMRSRDIGEAVAIQQEWLEGLIRRLDEDFSGLASESANMSRKAAATARDAVGQSSAAARAGARDIADIAPSTRHAAEEAPNGAHRETEEGGNGKHAKTRDHHGRRAA
ncbi:MAG TPA: hypothetical protein VGL83_07705 [Stellaceae bacterium]